MFLLLSAKFGAVKLESMIEHAMPTRAESIRGYVRGMHAEWLAAHPVPEQGRAGKDGQRHGQTVQAFEIRAIAENTEQQ